MRSRTEKNRILHKKRMRKLLRVAVLIVMLTGIWMILTAGFTSGAARLKNVKEPFIDLDSTIADAETGKGGNSETGLEDEGKDDASSKEQTDVVVELRIEIREETITIDGTEIKAENFENQFKARYKEDVQVVLVDDYAEYHTYKNVKDILENKGIKPIEEQN